MRKKLILLTFLLGNSLFTGLLGMTFTAQRVEANRTILAVINPETGNNEFTFPHTPVNSTFLANVTVMNISYLAGWQMNITWDPTLLRINSIYDVSIPANNVFGEYALPLGLTVTSNSMFWLAVILDAPINYVNVTSGTLCQIRFTIVRNATVGPLSCDLHFVVEGEHPNCTILGNRDAEAIPCTPLDGRYEMLKHSCAHVYIVAAIVMIALVGAVLLVYFAKSKKAKWINRFRSKIKPMKKKP